jgi:hypothetical protein
MTLIKQQPAFSPELSYYAKCASSQATILKSANTGIHYGTARSEEELIFQRSDGLKSETTATQSGIQYPGKTLSRPMLVEKYSE